MPDVGAGALAKRRIIPDDVIALSVFPFLCFGWFILQCVVVSAFVECFLVWGGRLGQRMLCRMTGTTDVC